MAQALTRFNCDFVYSFNLDLSDDQFAIFISCSSEIMIKVKFRIETGSRMK